MPTFYALYSKPRTVSLNPEHKAIVQLGLMQQGLRGSGIVKKNCKVWAQRCRDVRLRPLKFEVLQYLSQVAGAPGALLDSRPLKETSG